MRKILLTLTVVLFAVVFMYGAANAVQGVCSNCHTMHNSQNGTHVAKDDTGTLTTTPNAMLLKAGCVSCHTAPSGSMNDGDFGPAVLHTGGAPTMGDGGTNAGGDFYWVDGGSDEYGHNVAELPNATADSIIADNLPPGFDSTVGAGIGSSWSGNQLSCAGTYGCHGTHSAGDKWAAMKGAHHNNSSGTILAGASSTGESYRFLDGIAGIEDSDWQWTESASDHNDYKGTDDATDRQFDIGTTDYAASAAAGTISYLCAQCHGAFHAKAADDSVYAAGDPWRRHPTDIALPSNAGSEYSAYDNYSVEAPIGRPDLTTIPDNSLVVEGTDIVLCLSCHRAHGSDQPDLLRWDYSTQIAGDSLSGGCFTCHTTK